MTAGGQGRARGSRGARLRLAAVVGLAALGLLGACDDGAMGPPGDLFFGQVGRLEVTLRVPGALRPQEGEIVQELVWESTGGWTFTESISYQGVLGDANRVTEASSVQLVSEYVTLIEDINQSRGLQLLGVDDLLAQPDPDCGNFTRVTVRIVDTERGDAAAFTRCAEGSLGNNFTPTGAFPRAETAARVPQAALFAAIATLGRNASYSYTGSIPFATLDRGGDTPSPQAQPTVIRDSTAWREFWSQHAPGRSMPTVDFGQDMVVVGISGVRDEAGDSVEVRRILPVNVGTLIHVVEREPGDFCTPAAVRHKPFHIVVAPRTPEPDRFAEIGRDVVPCL